MTRSIGSRTWRASLTCLTLVLGAASSADAQPGPLFPRLKAGDSIDLVMTYEREDRVGKQRSRTGTLTVPVTIEVDRPDPDTCVMLWQQGRSKVQNPAIFGTVARLVALADGKTIKLVYDHPAMNFRGLRDAAGLTKQLRKRVDKVMTLAGHKPAPTKRNAYRHQLKQILARRVGVERVFTRKMMLYFLPYGWKLQAGGHHEYDDQLPNPFGGKPLPSKATIRLQQRDGADAPWHVTFAQRLTKTGSKRLKQTVVNRMTPHTAQPTQAQLNNAPPIEMYDEAKFTIDPDTQWIVKAQHIRTARIGKRSRLYTVRWRRAPDK